MSDAMWGNHLLVRMFLSPDSQPEAVMLSLNYLDLGGSSQGHNDGNQAAFAKSAHVVVQYPTLSASARSAFPLLFVRWRRVYSNCCHCHFQTPSEWARKLADMLCKLKIDAAPAF